MYKDYVSYNIRIFSTETLTNVSIEELFKFDKNEGKINNANMRIREQELKNGWTQLLEL